MKYGLSTSENGKSVEWGDGYTMNIPTEQDLKQGNTSSPGDPYYRWFRHDPNEPDHVHKWLLGELYGPASEVLADIEAELVKANRQMENWRDDLKPAEYKRRLAPHLQKLDKIKAAVRVGADQQLARVDEIIQAATIPGKPKDQHQALLREIRLSGLRQEIASAGKDATERAVSRVGQGSPEGDVLLVHALETSLVADKAGLADAKNRLVTSHYPWIETYRQMQLDKIKYAKARIGVEMDMILKTMLPKGMQIQTTNQN